MLAHTLYCSSFFFRALWKLKLLSQHLAVSNKDIHYSISLVEVWRWDLERLRRYWTYNFFFGGGGGGLQSDALVTRTSELTVDMYRGHVCCPPIKSMTFHYREPIQLAVRAGLELGAPHCKSGALTTQPRYLLHEVHQLIWITHFQHPTRPSSGHICYRCSSYREHKVLFYIQAFYLRESQKVTWEQHAKGDASARAPLALPPIAHHFSRVSLRST